MSGRFPTHGRRLVYAIECTGPIYESLVYHLASILSFSSEVPSCDFFPEDLVRMLRGIKPGRPVTLEDNVAYAIDFGIVRGELKRDENNPNILVPLRV